MLDNKLKKFLIIFSNHQIELATSVKEYLNDMKYRVDYDIIRLEYFITYGNISDLPFSNGQIYNEVYGINVNEYFDFTPKGLKILRDLNCNTSIEIFLFKNAPEELCNLYYFAKEFKRFPNVLLNFYHYEEYAISSIRNESRLVVDKQIRLTPELIDEYTKKWNNFVKNNSEIRGCINGEIVEYSLEQTEKFILQFITPNYKKFPDIYEDFLKKYNGKDNPSISYTCFNFILKSLENKNIIKRTHSKNTLSGYDDIYFEQKFKLVGK